MLLFLLAEGTTNYLNFWEFRELSSNQRNTLAEFNALFLNSILLAFYGWLLIALFMYVDSYVIQNFLLARLSFEWNKGHLWTY